MVHSTGLVCLWNEGLFSGGTGEAYASAVVIYFLKCPKYNFSVWSEQHQNNHAGRTFIVQGHTVFLPETRSESQKR